MGENREEGKVKGEGKLTLDLLLFTLPLLPFIQVCKLLAALAHCSFALRSPVVAKHDNSEVNAGRHGGGTVSTHRVSTILSPTVYSWSPS